MTFEKGMKRGKKCSDDKYAMNIDETTQNHTNYKHTKTNHQNKTKQHLLTENILRDHSLPVSHAHKLYRFKCELYKS